MNDTPASRRERRRLRRRRHRRRAYIRSIHFLPSLATLGNALCGFAACYVVAFDKDNVGLDIVANRLMPDKFLAAAYLLILAMIFDALDGRLARFARHTTDFGGQLDSLADVVSFGFTPAFVTLLLIKNVMVEHDWQPPIILSRLVWAIGALYFSCAAIRLARFNVSNEHGEQHHFSFLGLPSPGAASAVIGLILMQQDLAREHFDRLSLVCVWLLPPLTLAAGLLMVSNFRYPHIVNRYMRGKRSIGRLIAVVGLLLMIVVAHRYVFGIGAMAYAAWGPISLALLRRRRAKPSSPELLPPPPAPS